jgi:hypothetical protein
MSGIPQANISLGDGNDAVDLSRAGIVSSPGLVGPNLLSGGTGDDGFAGGPGADIFDGGDGVDTVDYSARTVPLGVTVGCNSTGFFCGPDGQNGENDDVQNSIERVFGGSANDSMSAGASARILDGRGGNDFLVGSSSGVDVLVGGTGADELSPLVGADRVYGQDGNDTIHARDGERDIAISCGNGTDFVEADLKDVMPPSVVTADCENVDTSAVDQGPNVRIASGPVRVRNGRAQVRLSCPRSPEGRCAGTLTLRRVVGTRGVSATPTSEGTFRVLTRRLGSAPYELAVGYSTTLRVPVTGASPGRVQVTSVETDANGKPKTTLATRPLRVR